MKLILDVKNFNYYCKYWLFLLILLNLFYMVENDSCKIRWMYFVLNVVGR